MDARAVISSIAGLGLAVTGAGASVAQTFSKSGPSADAYGAAKDYPVPERTRPLAGMPQEFMVGLHSRYDVYRRMREVPTSGAPSPLKRAAQPIVPIYPWDNRVKSIADYVTAHPVTGLLIARGDTILYEHYQYGRSDRDRMASWSLAKTVVGLLVGIAMSEGAIASIDDAASKYVPELAGTRYGATPIRALLQMSSGMEFRETYQPGDDVSKMGEAVFHPKGPGALAAIRAITQEAAPAGTRFNYSSADTLLLGLVLSRAVRMPLADYMSTRLWQKLGAESNAAWDIDPTGQEIAFCCLVATLRDWARLALMMAHEGNWNGQQIVPRQWIIDSTTAAPGSRLAPSPRGPGYGHQVWLLPGERRRYWMLGIHGQVIHVDPISKLVIVHTAVRLSAGPSPEQLEFSALQAAIIAQFALQ